MDNCIIYGGQLLTESEHRCAQIIEALGVWCAYSDAVRNSIRHYRLNESIDVKCHLDDIDEAIIYWKDVLREQYGISDNQLNEVLPAIAAALGAAGRGLAMGASAAGRVAAKGVAVAAKATAKAAQATGKALATAAKVTGKAIAKGTKSAIKAAQRAGNSIKGAYSKAAPKVRELASKAAKSARNGLNKAKSTINKAKQSVKKSKKLNKLKDKIKDKVDDIKRSLDQSKHDDKGDNDKQHAPGPVYDGPLVKHSTSDKSSSSKTDTAVTKQFKRYYNSKLKDIDKKLDRQKRLNALLK